MARAYPATASQRDASSYQPGTWVTLYDEHILIVGEGVLHVTGAPYALQYLCEGEAPFTAAVDIYVQDNGGGYSGAGRCSEHEGDGVFTLTYTNISGHTYDFKAFAAGGNGQAGAHIVLKGYTQVDDEVPLTPVPTNTPGPGGIGPTQTAVSIYQTIVAAEPGCGLVTDPCYVTDLTAIALLQTGIPSSGGGSGSWNAETPIIVGNFPTALPTATTHPAIATALAAAVHLPTPAAVPYEEVGPVDMPLAGMPGSEAVVWSITDYDFGCPIAASVDVASAGLCIKYGYLSDVTVVGHTIPLGVLTAGLCVLIIIGIIIKR